MINSAAERVGIMVIAPGPQIVCTECDQWNLKPLPVAQEYEQVYKCAICGVWKIIPALQEAELKLE